MDILYGLLVAFFILVNILLIVVILLQPGKSGGGLGALGGGSAASVFGGRGTATFLSKTTGVLAAIFFVLSVAIALTRSESSVVSDVSKTPGQTQSAPSEPEQQK